MSNQNENVKVIKRAFEFNSDSLDDLKLMALEERTTQKALINQFLDDGLREWRKSKGQSTLD